MRKWLVNQQPREPETMWIPTSLPVLAQRKPDKQLFSQPATTNKPTKVQLQCSQMKQQLNMLGISRTDKQMQVPENQPVMVSSEEDVEARPEVNHWAYQTEDKQRGGEVVCHEAV